jgi:hypothetical protein
MNEEIFRQTLLCDPADPEMAGRLAAAFVPLIGRRVRLILRTADEELIFVGQVPPRREWTPPDQPCLMVAPGTTGGPHVLANMALSLHTHDGRLVLARRRWYEDAPLDFQSLGDGPVRLSLELAPGE